jgi:hypothetical protein
MTAEQIERILAKTDTCFGDCDNTKECSHTGHGCYLWKQYAKEIVEALDTGAKQREVLIHEHPLLYSLNEKKFQEIQFGGLGISDQQSFEQQVNTAIAMAWECVELRRKVEALSLQGNAPSESDIKNAAYKQISRSFSGFISEQFELDKLRAMEIKGFIQGAKWAIKEITPSMKAEAEKSDGIISAYENYLKVLNDEINDLISIAVIHGWKSRNIERGEQARKAIEEAIGVQPEGRSEGDLVASKKWIGTQLNKDGSYSDRFEEDLVASNSNTDDASLAKNDKNINENT